jgi:hypothetical protein
VEILRIRIAEMIKTITDQQLMDKIKELEGPKLLALFLAMYSFHREGRKENIYEAVKTKVINRLKDGARQ